MAYAAYAKILVVPDGNIGQERWDVPICDPKNDNYLLIHAGWDNIRRIHSTVLHLRLRDGKILIEEDGLEHGVAQDLIDAGVSPKDIVYSLENERMPALRKAG